LTPRTEGGLKGLALDRAVAITILSDGVRKTLEEKETCCENRMPSPAYSSEEGSLSSGMRPGLRGPGVSGPKVIGGGELVAMAWCTI